MSQKNETSAAKRFLRSLLVIPVVFQLISCASPSYYSQAVSGHLDLMRQREDIPELLDSNTTDPALRRQLMLSQEIREFAVTRLLLPDNGSYSQFVRTGRDSVTWNVIAAPRFSLVPKKWCFPVSGCVPYRGYFSQQDAEGFATKLEARNFDVVISPAIAYSTLGWFDDPLLDTMFQYSDAQLAALIFHEMAHQELYLRGDTAFSESYASFMEFAGVRLWLRETGREPELSGWLKRRNAGRQFNALLRETRGILATLYASSLSETQMSERKIVEFENLRSNYHRLVEEQWDGVSHFESLLSGQLNNASLALVSSYQGGTCAFEMLFRDAREDMERFQQLALARSRLGKEQRRAWLDQPCEIIAPDGDL